ncbi:MAG: hypothetical protein LBK29_02815 [Oscillospiraceae bacterium]|jgi:hypothetical protein|nr:hypothetical protein [Oscillospiraceae bacterium]
MNNNFLKSIMRAVSVFLVLAMSMSAPTTFAERKEQEETRCSKRNTVFKVLGGFSLAAVLALAFKKTFHSSSQDGITLGSRVLDENSSIKTTDEDSPSDDEAPGEGLGITFSTEQVSNFIKSLLIPGKNIGIICQKGTGGTLGKRIRNTLGETRSFVYPRGTICDSLCCCDNFGLLVILVGPGDSWASAPTDENFVRGTLLPKIQAFRGPYWGKVLILSYSVTGDNMNFSLGSEMVVLHTFFDEEARKELISAEERNRFNGKEKVADKGNPIFHCIRFENGSFRLEPIFPQPRALKTGS